MNDNDADRPGAFLDALEDCRARVRAGESLDACLAGRPEAWHDELRALLSAGDRVGAAAEDPAPEFVARFEPVLLAAVDRERARGRGRGHRGRAPRWLPRLARATAWQAAALLLVALVLLGGTGVAMVEASADAVPGDRLYRVTELREAVELLLARSESARLERYEQRLRRRMAELERAVARGVSAERLARIERAFGAELRQVVNRALRLREAGEPRAAREALVALSRVRERIDRLVVATTDRRQRALLLRLDRFLAAQEQRLTGERARANLRWGVSPVEGSRLLP